MIHNRITINGQHYDSPEAMPPDVRRMYEQAMRAMALSSASGQPGGSTQVFTGQAGDFGASMVVNRVIAVNDRTYGSVDELPPEMRKLYEDPARSASGQATHQPKTGLHVSINLAGPKVRTDSGRSPTPVPLPIDASSTEARIRDIPASLAVLVVIVLVLWFLLGR